MSFSTRLARSRGALSLLAALSLGASTAALAQTAQPQPQRQPRPAAPAPAAPAPQAPAPQAPAPQAPGAPSQAGQQGAGPTVVQVKPEPSQANWTKVCSKDQNAGAEVCYTTRDFVSDQGQPVLAVAVYDVKGAQPQKVVRFLMPLGLLLQPGIRFAVDQGQPVPGRYALCFPNGCFAEGQTKDDVINAMKKGTTVNISVQNQVGREVTFAVPLAGFGKAFDGAPVDPEVLKKQQEELQKELQKRSDEMRKRLETSGGAAGAATAGAQPKP